MRVSGKAKGGHHQPTQPPSPRLLQCTKEIVKKSWHMAAPSFNQWPVIMAPPPLETAAADFFTTKTAAPHHVK